MQTVNDELEVYRLRIAELEHELEEMTAAVSQAWDQLVPFLQDTPQQTSSTVDFMPIIQATIAAADKDTGGIYLFQGDEWLGQPDHIVLLPTLRALLRKLSQPGETVQWKSDKSHNVAQSISWIFTPILVEHQVIGAIGVGSTVPRQTFNTVDVRIITRMAERAASQIVAEQLAESREREAAVQHELEIANMIQRSTQPLTSPKIPNVEVAYFWNPAKQVGGDTWGWVLQPDGRLAWFVLDVAGKGLPAALAAMSLHTAIRIGLRMELSPVPLMKIINEEFYDAYTRTDLMATVSIGVLEPVTGVFEQANAGHPPTLVRHDGVWHSLTATAPPIGVLPEMWVEPQRLTLGRDDLIVCYSDGFSEIETASGLWGEEGILSAIPADPMSAEELTNGVVKAASQVSLQQEIRDDQTLVIVKVKTDRPMQKTFTIPATLKAISSFSADLEILFSALPLDIRVSLVLAVQELGVNIVEHAYEHEPGNIQIDIEWTSDRLNIQFQDDAPHNFVPRQTIEAPDPLDLPEGGLGLFIIYQTFDEVNYTPLEHGNCWHLSKQMGG